MAVLVILILASLGVAGGFLLGFIWAVRAGQFDDTATPALRVLVSDESAIRSVSPSPPPALASHDS